MGNYEMFRKPKASEIIALKKYMKDMSFAARFFRSKFLGKTVVYVTETELNKVLFTSSNFSHLCGIEYVGGSNIFFHSLLRGKVDLSKVKIKTDNSTFLKLQVIKNCSKIIEPGIKISQDGVLGQNMYYRNSILSQEDHSGFFISLVASGDSLVPQSLINLSSLNDDEIPTLLSEVIEIFAVPHQNTEKKEYYYKKQP